MSKADKLCKKVGGSGNHRDWLPERPRGMHRRTYDKHHHQFYRLVEAKEQQLEVMMKQIKSDRDGLVAILGKLV